MKSEESLHSLHLTFQQQFVILVRVSMILFYFVQLYNKQYTYNIYKKERKGNFIIVLFHSEHN